MKNVGFIGIGKLGMACAEVMATKHNVTGYDIYPKTSDKIRISDNLRGAVAGQDIIFIACKRHTMLDMVVPNLLHIYPMWTLTIPQ